MKARDFWASGAVAAGLTCAASAGVVLDFDTDGAGNAIQAGQIIDDEYASVGITITTENLVGDHPDLGVAFDSANPTGGDFDLFTEQYGNILIIAESGENVNGFLSVDPDDEGGQPAGWFQFDMDFLADGLEIVLVDTEESGGSIDLFENGGFVGSVDIPAIGDGDIQTLDIGSGAFSGVGFDAFRVNLAGSGAVAQVTASAVPGPAALALLALAGIAPRRRRG